MELEMKTKILSNPDNGANIINYKIAEAELDRNGDVVIDRGNGQPVSTGNTFEWTLRKGETLRFPAYVADYLLSIYGFLKEVKLAPKDVQSAVMRDKNAEVEE